MNRLERLVVLGLVMVAGVVAAFVTGSADGVILNDSTYGSSYAVVVPGHPPDVAWFVLCVTASLAIAVLLLVTASRLGMQARSPKYEVVTAITIFNRATSPLHLIVEPWAEEQDVPVGGATKVTLSGPNKADVEIEVSPAGMALYGWTGSVLDDGINPPGPPVPRTP